MDVKFVNPVLESIVNVLSTMAHVTPQAKKPSIKKEKEALGVITGVIEMAGKQTKGSIAISLSKPVAMDITKRMLRMECEEVNEMVEDLVGEIANMMAGGAKAKLEEQGFDFELSLPRVVSGEKAAIEHGINAPVVVLPFYTEAGNFFVEICFPLH